LSVKGLAGDLSIGDRAGDGDTYGLADAAAVCQVYSAVVSGPLGLGLGVKGPGCI
jgi:hypothetical protein